MPSSRRRSRANPIQARPFSETLERWLRGEVTDDEAGFDLWWLKFEHKFADLTPSETEYVEEYLERSADRDAEVWEAYLQRFSFSKNSQ